MVMATVIGGGIRKGNMDIKIGRPSSIPGCRVETLEDMRGRLEANYSQVSSKVLDKILLIHLKKCATPEGLINILREAQGTYQGLVNDLLETSESQVTYQASQYLNRLITILQDILGTSESGWWNKVDIWSTYEDSLGEIKQLIDILNMATKALEKTIHDIEESIIAFQDLEDILEALGILGKEFTMDMKFDTDLLEYSGIIKQGELTRNALIQVNENLLSKIQGVVLLKVPMLMEQVAFRGLTKTETDKNLFKEGLMDLLGKLKK